MLRLERTDGTEMVLANNVTCTCFQAQQTTSLICVGDDLLNNELGFLTNNLIVSFGFPFPTNLVSLNVKRTLADWDRMLFFSLFLHLDVFGLRFFCVCIISCVLNGFNVKYRVRQILFN